MEKVRVLVVDDSAFMCKVISDLLTTDPSLVVIDKARNGKEAIRKVKELEPDVITLDVEMPEMDGIAALQTIMQEHPVPVVMISSLTREGADATIRALELGAVDFIAKPSGSISLDMHKLKDQMVAKVKAAAKARLHRFPPGGLKRSPDTSLPAESPTMPGLPVRDEPASSARHPKDQSHSSCEVPNLVVIGTSTGGPKALQVLLKSLPKDLPAAFLIVQHMPPGFTKPLAERLDSLSAIRVVEAEEGMKVRKGYAYIAPGNFHMEIRHSNPGHVTIALNQSEPRNGHRPSVDVLFQSAAEMNHPNTYAIIMTGMGSDGTNGLKSLKSRGCKRVIAEDESTCVVFGMPKSAILSGLVDDVLPLEQIGPYLVNILAAERRREERWK